MNRQRLLLLFVLSSACDRSEPAPAEPIESAPIAPPQVAPAPVAKKVHSLRVVALTGELTGEPALATDLTLQSAISATLAKGATLTLALDDDVRIELTGPAQIALLRNDRPVLLIHHGVVRVDVAAQGIRAGKASFVLATPSGQLDVPGAARLVLNAAEKGAHELAVISGEVALSQPTGPVQVGAGARYCLGAEGPRKLDKPGYKTLEAAGAALPTSKACADDKAANAEVLARELGHRLDALAAAESEQRDMLGALTSEPQNGERLRAQLTQSAQAALLQRTRALALRAQLEASELPAASDPSRAALLLRAGELESPAR